MSRFVHCRAVHIQDKKMPQYGWDTVKGNVDQCSTKDVFLMVANKNIVKHGRYIVNAECRIYGEYIYCINMVDEQYSVNIIDNALYKGQYRKKNHFMLLK